ncbi:MAG: type II toxin-antitoxin system VapB family antitoxin [Deltaproteobacteria bacterium]|nr:type II toxin-antitoxin system VapB family antitoxin [Deltaproteobacteria bacterium]
MNLPKELLEEAVKATGASTQTMAVVIALKEIVRKKKFADLSKLRGKVNIDALILRENRRR